MRTASVRRRPASAAVSILMLFERLAGAVRPRAGIVCERTEPVVFLFGGPATNKQDIIHRLVPQLNCVTTEYAQPCLFFALKVCLAETWAANSQNGLSIRSSWVN